MFLRVMKISQTLRPLWLDLRLLGVVFQTPDAFMHLRDDLSTHPHLHWPPFNDQLLHHLPRVVKIIGQCASMEQVATYVILNTALNIDINNHLKW